MKSLKWTLLLASLLTISAALADEPEDKNAATTTKETLVFKIKKSYHPKNVLNYTVLTNTSCEFAQKAGAWITPLWYMGENGGGSEGLNSTEKTYYSPKVAYINTQKNEFDFNLGAMEQMKKYIPNPTITVKSEMIDGKCVPSATMEIDKQEITVTQVFISGSMTIFLEWKTDYLTISGFYPDGKPFTKKITVKQ